MANVVYQNNSVGVAVPQTSTDGAADVNIASGLVGIDPNANQVSIAATVITADTTITVGGTAQLLFAVPPTYGYAVYNPDATNDLWVSDSATAAANGKGSVRVAANGGGYETPTGYKPPGPVSIVGAVTAQKVTARRW